MALRNYSSEEYGTFTFDDTQFQFNERGNLVYIGQETDGNNINIPYGIKIMDEMFKDTAIMIPPAIPDTVESAVSSFENCRNLQSFVIFPENCDTSHAFRGISTNPNERAINNDPIRRSIMNAGSPSIDREIRRLDKRLDQLADYYSKRQNIPGADERFENAKYSILLKKSYLEATMRLEILQQDQNYLRDRLSLERGYGAPVGYLQNLILDDQTDIDNIRVELNEIDNRIKNRENEGQGLSKQDISDSYRSTYDTMNDKNTSVVGDILKTEAINTKLNVISFAQKMKTFAVDKMSRISHWGKKVQGNIYKQTQTIALKSNILKKKAFVEIEKLHIKALQKTFNLSLSVNTLLKSVREGFKAMSAGMKGEVYTTDFSGGNSKVMDKIMADAVKSANNITSLNSEISELENELDGNLKNMSPNERKDTAQTIDEYNRSDIVRQEEKTNEKISKNNEWCLKKVDDAETPASLEEVIRENTDANGRIMDTRWPNAGSLYGEVYASEVRSQLNSLLNNNGVENLEVNQMQQETGQEVPSQEEDFTPVENTNTVLKESETVPTAETSTLDQIETVDELPFKTSDMSEKQTGQTEKESSASREPLDKGNDFVTVDTRSAEQALSDQVDQIKAKAEMKQAYHSGDFNALLGTAKNTAKLMAADKNTGYKADRDTVEKTESAKTSNDGTR